MHTEQNNAGLDKLCPLQKTESEMVDSVQSKLHPDSMQVSTMVLSRMLLLTSLLNANTEQHTRKVAWTSMQNKVPLLIKLKMIP